jgi:hypothetical protein
VTAAGLCLGDDILNESFTNTSSKPPEEGQKNNQYHNCSIKAKDSGVLLEALLPNG